MLKMPGACGWKVDCGRGDGAAGVVGWGVSCY